MSITASKTAICNYALVSVLGDVRINSIDDQTKNAQILRDNYDLIRQSELRKAFWKFSLKNTLLAASTPPADKFPNGLPPPYAYAYKMPQDCLRLISFAGIRQSLGLVNYRTGLEKFYDWQSDYIFTNLGTGVLWAGDTPATSQWIQYVADVTDTTQYDANFAIALACALGVACCEAITGANSKYQKALNDYNRAITAALVNNAIERLPEGMADDSYTLARL